MLQGSMSISPSHNRTPSPTAPSEDGRRSEKTNRLTAEFLQAEYVQGQKSILTIAEECQVDPGTVRRKLRAAGIPARSAQEANSRSYASDPPKSVLVESYSERQLSINQIAQELGIKSARVGYLLRTFEIPRRTAHQGQRLAAGLQIEKGQS
jgi:transposase-like protein